MLTKMVMAASDWFVDWWWALIIAIVGGLIAVAVMVAAVAALIVKADKTARKEKEKVWNT